MAVSDGQNVNALITNAAFLSRLVDSSTIGKIDLLETSTTDLINLQRIINEALSSLGLANQAATDGSADDYSSNNVVADSTDRKTAIGALDERFNGTTGHTHDGTDGEGIKVSATDLSDFNNLFAEFGEYTFDSASGTSIDVSSLFSSQSSGGDASTEGVITSAPNNFTPIVEKTNGGEIEDAEGDRVFSRLTEAAGTWTLSFYTNEAGTETAHSLSSQDIRFLYREVFTAANRPTIGANVGVYDTQSAVGDIPDASATQRGVVSTSAQSFAGVKEFTSRPTTNSIDIVDVSSSQALTEKDYDGGTASNTSRTTLPKDTTTNLDLLTDKEATIAYDTTKQIPVFNDGAAWKEMGGGGTGRGGLDVYYAEDFETTLAADLTGGNNATFDNGGVLAGAKADETGSPLAGLSSLKYTQAGGSLNDWVKSPTIATDEKQEASFSGLTVGAVTYDGDDDDIDLVFWDDTNNTILERVPIKASTETKRYSLSAYVPAGAANLAWGIHVKTLNSGAILLVDDVELSTNPFVYKNFTVDQTINHTAGGDTLTDRTSEVEFNLSNVTTTGDSIVTPTDDSGNTRTKFIANKRCRVWISWTAAVSATNQRTAIYKEGAIHQEGDQQSLTAGFFSDASTNMVLEAGEFFSVGMTTGQSVNNSAAATYLRVMVEADTEHVVTPSKVPKQYSEADGDFTVTGTNWTTDFAVIVPYVTGSDGTWRAKFNIVGTLSVAVTSLNATISGLTFKSGAAFLQPISTMNNSSDWNNAYVNPNSSVITGDAGALAASWRFSGDVELEGRPTWADDVSSNFLASVPTQLTAYVKDLKSAGTDGGGATSGSFAQRTLNTLEGDTEFISLAANRFTLQPGKYKITGEGSAYDVDGNQSKLVADPAGSPSDALIGTTQYSGTLDSDGTTTYSVFRGILEITSTTEYEVQTFVQTTKALNGYGVGLASGVSNIYTNVEITKIK